MRSMLTATILVVACLVSSPAMSQPRSRMPRVNGSVEGPVEFTLGAYDKHENHPVRKWSVSMNNGRFRTGLQSWVDIDPSHAPLVLPLEGMLGFPEPAAGNWYSNGFLNLWIGDQLVGTVPPKNVRLLETGERGRARFVWQRPEGTWSVIFVVLPDDDKVFCCVRLFPNDAALPLKIQLTCYPGGQTTDGYREVTTSTRSVPQTNTIALNGKTEWWYAIYDTVYDYGVKGDGGAGVLFDPDTLGEVRLEVTGYPVILRLTLPAGKHEIRMLLWDSFFGKKNEEITDYLRKNADNLLRELRRMSFEDRRILSDEVDREAQQIDELVGRIRNPRTEPATARKLKDDVATLRSKLRHSQTGISPDDEDHLMSLLAQQSKLLWELKWKELLESGDAA